MKKKFRVVAKSTIMDAEVNVRYEDKANEIFEKLRDSGSYHKIYIIDNKTGEVYRTYDISPQGGGVIIQESYFVGGQWAWRIAKERKRGNKNE